MKQEAKEDKIVSQQYFGNDNIRIVENDSNYTIKFSREGILIKEFNCKFYEEAEIRYQTMCAMYICFSAFMMN